MVCYMIIYYFPTITPPALLKANRTLCIFVYTMTISLKNFQTVLLSGLFGHVCKWRAELLPAVTTSRLWDWAHLGNQASVMQSPPSIHVSLSFICTCLNFSKHAEMLRYLGAAPNVMRYEQLKSLCADQNWSRQEDLSLV